MADKEIFYQTMPAIPIGRYTSYGTLATLCGVHVRQVQAWLRSMPKGSNLPWFRIINGQRKITAHSGALKQHQLLAAEGVLPDKRGKFPVAYFWPNDINP